MKTSLVIEGSSLVMNQTILYVEDNPRNMRLVRKLLQNAGYTVLEAEDGETGIKVATQELPDLILMDVNLPDIDGLTATGRLKEITLTNPIPVIALTANAMLGDRERCLAAGCTEYIPKPISRNILLEAVGEILKTTSKSQPEPEQVSHRRLQQKLKQDSPPAGQEQPQNSQQKPPQLD